MKTITRLKKIEDAIKQVWFLMDANSDTNKEQLNVLEVSFKDLGEVISDLESQYDTYI